MPHTRTRPNAYKAFSPSAASVAEITSGITPVEKAASAIVPATRAQKPESAAKIAVNSATPSVAIAKTRTGERERSAIRPHVVGATIATSGDIVTTMPTSVPVKPALSLK